MAIGGDGRVWIRNKDDEQIVYLDGDVVVQVKDDYDNFKKFALAPGPNNTVFVTNAANDRLYTL